MPNPLGAAGVGAASGAAAGTMVAPGVGTAIGAGLGLVGGLADAYFGQEASEKDWKRQKKVLQNQVQWRVEDAVAAGLHPLAALGVNPASGPSTSLGTDFQNMGQNIGRAAEAMLTPADKSAARMLLLQETRVGLENDLLRAQIAGAQKALLTQGATPGVASPIPARPGFAGVSMPGYNDALQPHYGEGADIITFPWLVKDVLSQPGNMLDPALVPKFPVDVSGNRVWDYVSDWFTDYRS